jgi:hypothetical protein
MAAEVSVRPDVVSASSDRTPLPTAPVKVRVAQLNF